MRFFGRLTHVVVTLSMPAEPVALPANASIATTWKIGKRRAQQKHRPDAAKQELEKR